MKKYILLSGLILICFFSIAWMNPYISGIGTSSAVDYSDIIFYHDCNALDNANKSGGSATIAYDSGWDLLVSTNGGTAILGADSWDNDNDGYENISFAISGNVDFASGRIGFYFRPQELATGYVCFTDMYDLILRYDNNNDMTLIYLGAQIYDIDNGASALSIETLYYIEIEFNGTSATIYVNGNNEGTVNGTGVVDDTDFRMGARDGNQWDAHYDQLISSNDPERDLNAIKDITNFN